MACSLKCGSYLSLFNETMLGSNSIKAGGFSTSLSSSESKDLTSKRFPVLSIDFLGKPLVVQDQKGSRNWRRKPGNRFSVQAETTCVAKGVRWWEKNLRPNMVKIRSAEELVGSLQNAGDRLVIIDFYSPGCGGCKALQPKIKKFKDALAKHGADRCSPGPAKGLDESELMKLSIAGELSTNLQLRSTNKERMEDLLTRSMELSGILNKADGNKMKLEKEAALL
ncbi:thioredoxin-like 1-1, chloroplastic isoform X2 [Durio zibethinus]|uniref:Thioredoxin-like 1-1, chloroplastic isoform X2 n=1 Tax=Durio zibethinus TaxID=66656 RepID=A0A6P5Y977_DURZI|nr:thioredoxin-like 1-1, chloroplastic isoform X2 [Durio zibethinus]